jgi:curved DNA-binding protein CbpA
MSDDHYRTLGVSRSATLDDIKAAFREQAKRFHPDVNPGNAAAEESFKRVNEAYTVLSDTAARTTYNSENAFAGYDWTKAARPDGGDGRARRQSVGRAAWVRTASAAAAPDSSFDPIDGKEWFQMHYGLNAAERAARQRAAERADERFGSKRRGWEARRAGKQREEMRTAAGAPESYRSFAKKFRTAQRASERAVPWIALGAGFLALAIFMTVQRDGIPGDGRRPVPDR